MVGYSSSHKGLPSTVTCTCDIHFTHKLLKYRAPQHYEHRAQEHHHLLLIPKSTLQTGTPNHHSIKWSHMRPHWPLSSLCSREGPPSLCGEMVQGANSHTSTLSQGLKDHQCCEESLQLVLKVWQLIFPSLRNSAHDLY